MSVALSGIYFEQNKHDGQKSYLMSKFNPDTICGDYTYNLSTDLPVTYPDV